MRKYIAPLFVALLAAAPAGAAYAATTAPAPMAKADQSVQSTIKSINLTARSLDLADGSRYALPAGYKAPANLKAGDKVTVHWKANGSGREVTGITLG